ncbi:hypothetical protein ACNTMW_09100 [Planosporangium sp. 12N6]|uniref:hypothetical protein n=1 Tax=Planosporangium spinosum TaxID=3402278 RepID=UPI003CF0D4C7
MEEKVGDDGRNRPPTASLSVMSAYETGKSARYGEQTADALSVEGWRRGIVHEGPDV